MIEVENLEAGYGEVPVLREVSLRLAANETVAVIGANGAGKSTLVGVLCGLVPARAGRIVLGGTDVTRLAAHQRVRRGISVVLEGRHLFGPMSARQHFTLGTLKARVTQKGEQRFGIDDVLALFPFLRERLDDPVELMSGGEQQMVALGRALMSRPEVLVIDEMSLGLAPRVVAGLAAHLRALNAEEGLAVLLIEQNARLALELCTRAYVLEAGRVVAHGSAAELASSPAVVAAYLGGAVEDGT